MEVITRMDVGNDRSLNGLVLTSQDIRTTSDHEDGKVITILPLRAITSVSFIKKESSDWLKLSLATLAVALLFLLSGSADLDWISPDALYISGTAGILLALAFLSVWLLNRSVTLTVATPTDRITIKQKGGRSSEVVEFIDHLTREMHNL